MSLALRSSKHFLVFLAVAIIGCQNEPRLFPVTGIVSFGDGQRIPAGSVEFMPVDGGPAARGAIKSDGTFELRTGSRIGAVAGQHRVVVLHVAVNDGYHKHVHRHPGFRVVHSKHRRYETSGIECQIEPRETNHIKVVVSSDR